LNTNELLMIYYIGFSFPIFLLWACFADTYDTTSESRDRRRGVSMALAAIGLAHPALAWCALDIARQLNRPEWQTEPRARTALVVAQRAAVASVLAAAVLLVLAFAS
jgi:hypothetical protein